MDLKEIYYKPEHMWKGKVAIEKLSAASGLPKEECQKFLENQVIYQIYLPAPRNIIRNSFLEDTPNALHQADLLFLPHDEGFKYCLTVIDVASRYKAGRPLKSKKSSDVAEALHSIYDNSTPLTWPNRMMTDSGTEFKAEFHDMLMKKNVVHDVAPKGMHRRQAFVERFNRTLAEKLFTVQYAKELLKEARKEKNVRSREWVADLQTIITELNNTPTRMINLKPVDAMNMKTVPVKRTKKDEVILELSPEQKVRYLLEPGEAENDTVRRATDPIWSMRMYDIEYVSKSEHGYYMYHLDGVIRNFVREELLVVNAKSEYLET